MAATDMDTAAAGNMAAVAMVTAAIVAADGAMAALDTAALDTDMAALEPWQRSYAEDLVDGAMVDTAKVDGDTADWADGDTEDSADGDMAEAWHLGQL